MPPHAASCAARFCFAVLLGAFCATAAHAQKFDETPRVAIISAFEPEWQAHQRAMDGEPRPHTDNGVTFVTGAIEGREVVLFLSGIGMVNAAMTTQLAIDRFSVSAIVFSGIAGGVDPALGIGDIVVAEEWGSYLHMVLAREGADGYTLPPFFPHPFPNYGMIFPHPLTVRREGTMEAEEKFWFAADPGLLDDARRAAKGLTLERCNQDGACLGTAPQIIVGGRGVSGSAFVDNAEFRRYVFETFDASLLDMESAAVAQVAYANAVPFLAIRSLSDLAGGGSAENELPVFFGLAAENAARMVHRVLAAGGSARE